MRRRMRTLATAALILGAGTLALGAADPFADAEKAIDKAFGEAEGQMDAAMAAVDAQWNAFVAAEEARWEALRAEVEAKWDHFVGSTETVWVDYSPDREARSQVDYENGQVVVEVLIPAESVKVPPKDEPIPVELPPEAVEKVKERVAAVAAPDPATGESPVAGQVETPTGKPLTPETAAEVVEAQAPQAVVEPQVIQGDDGKERRKARVVIPMVPKHLYVRAAKYKDEVTTEAERYGLEPQLVFAVIQTESYFNPKARSPAHAYGLMQLIPRYAALEAYEFLYGEKKLVDPDYLYVPENNIRLGTAYLHLLHTRYYGKVKDPTKREILAVASYNWGPGIVRRKVLLPLSIETVPVDDLRAQIDRVAPKETRDYVERVTTRKPIYDGLVGL